MINRRFALFAWANVAYNLLVIIGGAFVRATGSGAGCGDDWPLCDGQVIPRNPDMEMMIEFGHRLTSGFALLGTLIMLIWAFRVYIPGHIVRRSVIVAMAFMIIEALLGAALVVLQLVAMDTSINRAVMMALHLVNTFLLLGALTLNAWWASGGAPISLQGQGRLFWPLVLGLVGACIVGASGAVTALGDTLLHHGALPGGIDQPMSRDAHPFVQMRLYHPITGLLLGIYVLYLVRLVTNLCPDPQARRFGTGLVILIFIEIILGGLTVALRAPIWLQLVHLFMADLVWICLVLLSAVALAKPSDARIGSPQTTRMAVQV
ncbi:COX15/CtaA family protein [Candidatus Viridilinea mediisalina]|uniref:Cytochrome oxidase assembly protein n=1 Tax=Candidatus Viridilinea mediisalina TaxID=2024553 RepID=A0A2A6RMB8_9CHLR|nr:COX15/CtaA family protein [Candidatus Viridilinea mediisalina]PDW04009.1 cytochrome oxidase assembly protein [Candidatus Viridilinea mediisalina]